MFVLFCLKLLLALFYCSPYVWVGESSIYLTRLDSFKTIRGFISIHSLIYIKTYYIDIFCNIQIGGSYLT